MSTTKTFTLDEVLAAMKALPQHTQQQLAHEIMDRVDNLSHTSLSEKQRDIIKARLSHPREQVSCDTIHALLRKYNPVL